MTNTTPTQEVTGGNVGYKTQYWTWINANGVNAHEFHYWFTKAFQQDVKILTGTYDYDKRHHRLRCLNLRVGGSKEAVSALHSIIEQLCGRGTN